MTEVSNMTELTPAERMYRRHLAYVKDYQKNNPDKVAEKCKRYRERINADETRREEVKEKRKLYYTTIIKPKREAEKKQKPASA
jgi:hypothetical protein